MGLRRYDIIKNISKLFDHFLPRPKTIVYYTNLVVCTAVQVSDDPCSLLFQRLAGFFGTVLLRRRTRCKSGQNNICFICKIKESSMWTYWCSDFSCNGREKRYTLWDLIQIVSIMIKLLKIFFLYENVSFIFIHSFSLYLFFFIVASFYNACRYMAVTLPIRHKTLFSQSYIWGNCMLIFLHTILFNHIFLINSFLGRYPNIWSPYACR